MGGSTSDAWTQNFQRAIADTLPNAKHKTLEGQNHMVAANGNCAGDQGVPCGMTTKQTFKAELFKGEGDTAGFVIPDKVVAAFGQGKKPKVTVTLNGRFSYPNTVAVMGGKFLIGVSKERRKLAGVTPGEMIDVTLELDTAPRVMEVPPDLQKALDKDKAAKAYFATLSYSNQRRHIDNINGAKTEETRARRIEKSVALFHEGRN